MYTDKSAFVCHYQLSCVHKYLTIYDYGRHNLYIFPCEFLTPDIQANTLSYIDILYVHVVSNYLEHAISKIYTDTYNIYHIFKRNCLVHHPLR